MPRISAFYGIVIAMYYNDHNPPHFHAIAGDREALIRIADGGLHEGGLAASDLSRVQQWHRLHQRELEENWVRARARQPLLPIEPLP